MNRVRFTLYSFVFLISAVLGLATARSLSTFFEISVDQQPGAKQSGQKNIIVIQVDDLEKRDPELVSVWTLFSVQKEQSFFTMTPLYPAVVPDPGLSRAASSFDLNWRKQPARSFIEAMDLYQVDWDGYMLVDRQGVEELHHWLAGRTLPANQIAQGSEIEVLLQQDAMLFAGICQGLNQAGVQPDETVEWTAIYPAMLKTNLPMQNILSAWQQNNQQQTPLVCNILTN